MKKFELVFVLSARDRNMTDEFLFLHQQTSNNIKRKKSEHREQKRKYTHIQSTRKKKPQIYVHTFKNVLRCKENRMLYKRQKAKKKVFFSFGEIWFR
jgi:aspartokinase